MSLNEIYKSKIVRTMKEYSDLIGLFNSKTVAIVKLNDLIDKDTFINFFGEDIFDYSYNGNSTFYKGKIKLNDNLIDKDRKYIFSDVVGTSLFIKLEKLIPKPRINKKIIRARIYSGAKGTGSHFHHHPPAVNYLISGKKLWIVAPITIKNYKFYLKHMEYGKIEMDLTEWINENKMLILENFDNLITFTQESGTVVYVPNHFIHFVLNLTDVIGITYSWESKPPNIILNKFN